MPDNFSLNEVRPRLVLRVGVAGHRFATGKLAPADIPGLEAAIERILGAFQRGLDSQLDAEESRAMFDGQPALIRFISSLAEGADRAAATAALASGCALECPLPFPREEYERDFETAQSKADFHRFLTRAAKVFELPGERRTPERSYQAAGLVMLRQSDVLIAIWDGETGKRGGTAEMVQHAVRAQIPVIVLDPKRPEPRLMPHRGYAAHDARDLARRAEVMSEAALASLARQITEPPLATAANGHAAPVAAERLFNFYGERLDRRFNPWLAYAAFLALFQVRGIRARDAMPATQDDVLVSHWQPVLDILEQHGARDQDSLKNVVLPRYALADTLSVHLSHVYRSSYILNFVLSALAVAFALAGLVSQAPKTLWLGLEIIAIGTVFLVALSASRQNWHVRWLDYRQLAEQLRHSAILSVLGSSPVGLGTRRVSEDGDAGPLWVNWYVRATAREMTLPASRVDKAYLAGAQAALERAEIDDQIAYHKANAHRLEHLHERLHIAGHSLLVLTLLVCAFFLAAGLFDVIDFKSDKTMKYWLAFVCGVFPAFGATLFAIRVQGDFEGAAARSEAMAERLQSLKAELAAPLSDFLELLLAAESAASSMFSELSDWRYVYSGKPVDVL